VACCRFDGPGVAIKVAGKAVVAGDPGEGGSIQNAAHSARSNLVNIVKARDIPDVACGADSLLPARIGQAAFREVARRDRQPSSRNFVR